MRVSLVLLGLFGAILAISGREVKSSAHNEITTLREIPKKHLKFIKETPSRKFLDNFKSSGRKLKGGKRAVVPKGKSEKRLPSVREQRPAIKKGYIIHGRPLLPGAYNAAHALPKGFGQLKKDDGHYVFRTAGEESYNPSFGPSPYAVRHI